MSFNSTGSIRLVHRVSEATGKDLHRHGWPWVVEQLQQLEAPEPNGDALLFDDFIEKTFIYKIPRAYSRPWTGIFHHPPFLPKWCQNSRFTLDALLKVPEFRDSMPYLRCAFALTEYLAGELRKVLSCPIHVLPYPGPRAVNWSPDNFRRNDKPALLQFGVFMRNTHISFQVPPCTLRRVRYLPKDVSWIKQWDNIVNQYWLLSRRRRYYSGVDVLTRLPDEDYDQALSGNVLIAEFFAGMASTLIVECIARGTPILVNRQPAVAEYLGESYPFYFDTPEEIPDMLQFDKIVAAHEHLKSIPEERLDPLVFLSAVQQNIKPHLNT